MASERRTEIRVEIEPDTNPITGLVVAADGRAHDFHGWMQLIAAVEAALGKAPERDEDRGRDPDDRR